MASATTESTKSKLETCVLCLKHHNRTRPSFCQCQHCSIPLCFDCMKEHHEELLQDVDQISHQYNELQQLIQNKQVMIVDDTAKSIEDVNQYFDAHIDQLRETQKKIIENMEVAKQNAQDHIREVDADLRLIGGEIRGLAKESVVQTAKMKTVSEKLKKLEQHLNTYQLMKTENGINIQPDISIRFDCPPVEIAAAESSDMEINDTCQAQLKIPPPSNSFSFTFDQVPVMQERPPKNSSVNLFGERPPMRDTSFPSSSVNFFGERPLMRDTSFQSSSTNCFEQLSTVPKPSPNPTGNKVNKKDDNSDSSDSDDGSDATHIDTSDDVDRMASDGENIFYTTYHSGKPDCIAYCCVESDDDDEDEYRRWNRSRIVDIIWWNSVKKFICATKEGICTVVYANKKFKITEVIDGKWSFVRVAANTNHLYLWIKSEKNNFRGIEVYSTEFEPIRKIDFDNHRNELFINESIGFCVTDKLIASIHTQAQKNNKILEVTFCDMNMNKSNSITLGECNHNTEIRTDGNDRFFITTGQRTFHIVSSNGQKQTTELEKNGRWLAVLDDGNVAVSNGHTDIQLVSYSAFSWVKLFLSK